MKIYNTDLWWIYDYHRPTYSYNGEKLSRSDAPRGYFIYFNSRTRKRRAFSRVLATRRVHLLLHAFCEGNVLPSGRRLYRAAQTRHREYISSKHISISTARIRNLYRGLSSNSFFFIRICVDSFLFHLVSLSIRTVYSSISF